jgi:hypothetical protein
MNDFGARAYYAPPILRDSEIFSFGQFTTLSFLPLVPWTGCRPLT